MEYITKAQAIDLAESLRPIAGNGITDAFIKGIEGVEGSDRFAEAFGNIAWYNGYDEWLWQMSDELKATKENEVYRNKLPTEEWMTDKHALWMMLVSAFGNWGTSIRGGWIEKKKEAAAFIDEATEREE